MDRPPGRSTDMRSRTSATIAVARRSPCRPRTDTFAQLYERSFPRVYAYVASLLRDRSAAEDVTAQAFERAYRQARRSYRSARGSVEALAVRDRPQRRARRAAPPQAPRAARRRARGPRLAGPDEERRARPPARGGPRRARRLDARERDLVALKFAGGLSNAEIAARARHLRVERRHPTAPNRHEAEEGLR